MSKKSKLVGCILLQMVNIDISITVIYDIFDIHKLTGLQVVFFFYFTENSFLDFLECHFLFTIDCLLFMIDFRIPHANFKFLF